jgi:hypothetical protein
MNQPRALEDFDFRYALTSLAAALMYGAAAVMFGIVSACATISFPTLKARTLSYFKKVLTVFR